MIDSLVAMYRKGAITADHLIVEALQRVDPLDASALLDAIPEEVLSRMLEFTRRSEPNELVVNYGEVPTFDQIVAARRWIERRRGPIGTPASTTSSPVQHKPRW